MFACLALQHSTKTKNPGFATNSRKNTNYKTIIFKKKSISKRKEREDSFTLENKGNGSKKFQVAITIGGHLQKVMERQVAKCCCKTTTKKKTTKP